MPCPLLPWVRSTEFISRTFKYEVRFHRDPLISKIPAPREHPSVSHRKKEKGKKLVGAERRTRRAKEVRSRVAGRMSRRPFITRRIIHLSQLEISICIRGLSGVRQCQVVVNGDDCDVTRPRGPRLCHDRSYNESSVN